MSLDDLYTNEFDAIPLTMKSIKEFLEINGDLRLNGYAQATEEFVILLTKILERNSDFQSLKKELTQFIGDRKDFGQWLETKFDDRSGKYQIE